MTERPPVVLAVGGLDPSGGAGLAMDARAAAGADVFLRPVASAITVQDSRRVESVQAVDATMLRASLTAAFADGVDVVKTGLLRNAAAVESVAESLLDGLPLVVDPVLRATSGHELVEGEVLAAYPRLLGRATLVTPNAAEARRLTGLQSLPEAAWALRKMGARNVLVKGGDEPGERVRDLLLTEAGEELWLEASRTPGGPWRGTGCALATLTAAHLAQGYAVIDAVKAAVDETREAITRSFPQPGAGALAGFRSILTDARAHDPDARHRLARVAAAWRAITPMLERKDVPEVGSNLSFLPESGDIARSAGLSARCVRTGRGVTVAGPVELGGIHHTARIASAAHDHDWRVRAAMNLRYRPELIDRARIAGLKVASFRREDQPSSEPSTVAWGTRVAVGSAGGVPDIIYDLGGLCKEPIVRLLAADPEGIIAILDRILPGDRGRAISAGAR